MPGPTGVIGDHKTIGTAGPTVVGELEVVKVIGTDHKTIETEGLTVVGDLEIVKMSGAVEGGLLQGEVDQHRGTHCQGSHAMGTLAKVVEFLIVLEELKHL